MEELFNKIIYKSIKNKATDIHLKLKDDLLIYFRVYNQLILYKSITNDIGNKLINYIKYHSGINTNISFSPQTGMMKYIEHNQSYDLRVSYIPEIDGESIVIRILNNHPVIDINHITKLDEIKKFYCSLKDYNQGLVLFSGPTGSGKSTTLYTLMDYLYETTHKNIISIEDPIEIKKDYVTQIEINENIGLNYETILKQILRHDPDIIVIGEIRDESVAKIAITCALTGHLVLTTIHSSSCILALKRLLNLNISAIDLEDVLLASISQKILYINNEVVILSELINREGIRNYLEGNQVQYNSFKDNTIKLINEYKYSIDDFKGELNE